MTEVCVRVSWEVTRACQVHLPLDDLFSPITKSPSTKGSAGGKDSLSLVESAIRCCKEWRTCYMEVSVVLDVVVSSSSSPSYSCCSSSSSSTGSLTYLLFSFLS